MYPLLRHFQCQNTAILLTAAQLVCHYLVFLATTFTARAVGQEVEVFTQNDTSLCNARTTAATKEEINHINLRYLLKALGSV